MPEMYVRDGERLRLRMHPGQMQAWKSTRRFIGVLAGTQGGKTSWGPWWLAREIDLCGPGDYAAVSATYDLFNLKMLPALREVFEDLLGIGRYWAGGKIIEIADPATGRFWAKRASDKMWGRVILRSAEAEGGLESLTAKAAWIDEAGQPSFRVTAWEAIRRRVGIARGRILLTTTIYNHNWLKTQVYDRWAAGHPDYDIIQFDSTENPAYSFEEFEEARASMPPWRFEMQYRGRYERPAGLIYDSFDDKLHVRPRIELPSVWPRFLGLDFGGVNTAGMFYAAEPGTPRLWAYRQYKAGGRTAKEHAAHLKLGEPMIPWCAGGSKSEGQWRSEFQQGGLPVREPNCSEVEVGIDRVYGAHKRGEIVVFDDLADYLSEKRRYSRKLDRSGLPTEEIEDKSSYHLMDAERYILGWLKAPNTGAKASAGPVDKPVGAPPFPNRGF